MSIYACTAGVGGSDGNLAGGRGLNRPLTKRVATVSGLLSHCAFGWRWL